MGFLNQKQVWAWTLVLFCGLFMGAFRVYGKPNLLFEGFYKISSKNNHIGYYIQRYSLDAAQKMFVSTYFLHTVEKGKSLSESLKAYSTQGLKPIKYQYTLLQGQKSKTIDAFVQKQKTGRSVLSMEVSESGRKKPRVMIKPMKEEAFFSTFAIYLLLKNPVGIKVGENFPFFAIAEELGASFPGSVFVQGEERFKNFPVYKIIYKFHNTQFVNLVNQKGESLLTISPVASIKAELVKNPKEAIGDYSFNQKSLNLLFGDIPKGVKNLLHGSPP